MRLDIFISDFNIAIEVHGQQHFDDNPYFDKRGESYELRHTRDTVKKRLCEEHGIRIFYYSGKRYTEEYDLGKVYTDANDLCNDIFEYAKDTGHISENDFRTFQILINNEK